MSRLSASDEVNRAVRWVRSYIPGLKIKFRTVPDLRLNGRPCHAVCTYWSDTKQFRIQLNPEASDDTIIDALLHELAHVIDVYRHGGVMPDSFHDQHSESWGVEYARITQDYFRDLGVS